MSVVRKSPRILLLLAMAAGSATASLAAQQEDPSQDQQQEAPEGNVMTTVYGTLPSPEEMTKGPEIEGIISARGDGRMQVRTADGNNTMIAITENTRIKSSGGFLGLSRNKLAADSLLKDRKSTRLNSRH